jgi:DNA-binding transcriptional LysR family regulator
MKLPKAGHRFRKTVRIAQLELLAELHRAPTLSAAAKAAGVAQPAASRLLKTLSDVLGIPMFEKVGRAIRPTPAGHIMLQRAATLIADLDRIEEELDAVSRGLVGNVSLGAGIASCYVLVPDGLQRLLNSPAKISVSLREGGMDELCTMLREGKIDLLVGRFEDKTGQSDLVAEDLYDPPMRIVCGAKNPIARRRNLAFADVLERDWLLPEAGTPMRAGIEALFRAHKAVPESCLIESSSIQTNVTLLNRFDLVWVLSADIAAYFEKLGQIKTLALPRTSGPGPFVLVRLRNRVLSPAAERLRDCLKAAATALTQQSVEGRVRKRISKS